MIMAKKMRAKEKREKKRSRIRQDTGNRPKRQEKRKKKLNA